MVFEHNTDTLDTVPKAKAAAEQAMKERHLRLDFGPVPTNVPPGVRLFRGSIISELNSDCSQAIQTTNDELAFWLEVYWVACDQDWPK